MTATRPRLGLLILFHFAFFILHSAAAAADWVHWRGPEQTGQAKGVTLPESFGLSEPGKNNLVWKTDVGGRSAPIKLGDKLFFLNGYDAGELTEGERVSCLNAVTGKKEWEYRFNVYHADVVTSRLGWTTLTADPATGRIYTHTTSGAVVCLDTAGKLVWQRHLSEEFGRFTGYGGRISSPIFDSGLVIVGVIQSSWGDLARGAGRYLAFDGATGEVVWITEPEPTFQNRGTYQSNPVIAVIGGQRLFVTGGSDGALHALKVRTGEKVWSYLFASGAINPSPVVDGDLVYCAHGEENPEGGAIGRVICVDAGKVDPKTKKPKLVWEYRRSNRFGLSHPALADGKLYIPDDAAELFCFNAKTGKLQWKYRYGTVARGAPLVADGRVYVFDVNAKLAVLKLNGDKIPDEAEAQEYPFRVPEGRPGFAETHGTPIAVDGRLYFCTQYETFCVGDPSAKPGEGKYKPMGEEAPFNPAAPPVTVRVRPFEAVAKPGAAVALTLEYLDANGRAVNPPADAKPEWSLPTPPVPKGATTAPPPLKAKVEAQGNKAVLTIDKVPPGQAGYVGVKVGELTARGRVRVVPQIPYKQDFENVPEGAVPGGWVNAQGKFYVTKLPDGAKVLAKVNTDGRPPIARANGYITAPDSAGYTIEADVMGTEVGGKYADMGVVASRYTLILDGKTDPETGKRTVRLASWDARPRVNKVIPFDWKKDTWYRTRLTLELKDKSAVVRGKVWERGQPEPAEWTVEFDDPSPNREGAAALYGYVTSATAGTAGAAIYYDNVSITPVGKGAP